MRLAILVSDFARRWQDEWSQRLTGPLAAAGVDARLVRFEAPGDLAVFDAVTPLLAWGYHHQPHAWDALLARLEAGLARAINPVAALRWNTDKRYLRELEAAGVPVAPTLFFEALTPEAVDAARARFGCEVVVVKPVVSAGASHTLRVAPGDSLEGGPLGATMIQPFLPSVAQEGELSLLYFGGRFSHAVVKVATGGDFRVQPQHGGQVSAVAPTAEALEVARGVLAAAPAALTYARVDLIRALDGRLALMELELIEPSLFLAHAKGAGAAFAAAVVQAVAG